MFRIPDVALSGAIAFALAMPVGGHAFAATAAAAKQALHAGEILNQSNWQKAEGLLPPEILKHYRTGEYVNRIVDWPPGTFHWPPDFAKASKANEGRFVIGTHGEVIGKATGKQPPLVLGFPFPTIDATDPKAANKIIWNYFYLNWYWGNLHAEAQVNWVGARKLQRRSDQDVNFMYYDGVPKRDQVPNPQNFSTQQLLVTRFPTDLNGTAALTWRYRDPTKRDSTWAFVPVLRRVRAVSPANRSDGFLGSDMSQDDGPFFDGKVEDFTWTLKGEVDQLRVVDPINLQGKSKSEWLSSGGWRAFWPDMPYLGYHDPNWHGVAWAPIAMALAKRHFWVVEAVPKDQYYLYGRLQLYIDKETFQGAWNRKFSWRGELLNTFQVLAYNPQKYTRPDGTADYIQGSNMNFQCAENIKAHQATVAGQKSAPQSALDLRVPYKPTFFDMNSLSRFGK
ncbi:MAG: outer membrane lipoprotein-sorting protein [Candidatus Binatia bacterium]